MNHKSYTGCHFAVAELVCASGMSRGAYYQARQRNQQRIEREEQVLERVRALRAPAWAHASSTTKKDKRFVP